MPQAFTIKTYFPDGDPNGLRIISRKNRIFEGVFFHRAMLNDVKKRDEFSRPGVYILVNDTINKSIPQIYIGQAGNVVKRLNDHYANKDFWEWCIFFTPAVKGRIGKTEILYLEAYLYDLAQKLKRCELKNDQTPSLPILSEDDTAEMEDFVNDILDICPQVGLEFFKEIKKPKQKSKLLYIDAKGVKATGYESSNDFIVCEGSQVHLETTNSIHKCLLDTRAELMKQGVIIDNKKYFIFTRDYSFSSPSTAAGIVLGRSANGRIEWKDKNGKTLKDLQGCLQNA